MRDFTVEGALAEIDRLTMERKDTGELVSPRTSARNNSIDNPRSPSSLRSSSLGNVPEDSAFAIGDDEDEDGEASNADLNDSRPTSAGGSAVEEALPLQSRSMSEKARGKQPIGYGNFSRSTSRNNSNVSLPSMSAGSTHSQSFVPNYQWVSLCHDFPISTRRMG